MNRALGYAHRQGVTLVGALGNNHEDISNPRPDTRPSPDYPPVDTEHQRTIDNANCLDLPVEGPHVIGVSALGPSERKADYSNWATDLTSGELEVSAPGGWFRDGFGTDSFRTNGNLILSAAPLNVLQAEGAVDTNGNITKPAAPRVCSSLRQWQAANTGLRRTTSGCRARRWRRRTPPASRHWWWAHTGPGHRSATSGSHRP